MFRDVAILAFLVMFVHVMLLLMGYETMVARVTFYMPLPVGVMAIALSVLMHYCRLHQFCLAYSSIVSFCMDKTTLGSGFGDALTIVRLTLLSIGVVILCGVLRKLSNKEIWTRKE